jgi:hypothetical protein
LRRILPWACFGFAAATMLVLALTTSSRGQAAPAAPAVPAAPGATAPPADSVDAEDKVPLRMTKGEELSAEEDQAVRATLSAYLAAVQKRDWPAAAKHVDRASFLAGVDPLIARVAPNVSLRPEVTRAIFGVSTNDSLARLPTEKLFASMMAYAQAADPNGVALMEKAKFSLLGARKLKGEVAIAYQLTIPPDSAGAQPYTRVTAERLRKVGAEWKILIQND